MAAGDLCTLSDVRLVLEYAAADTSRDALISDRITAASQMIRSYTERQFTAESAATKRFQVYPGQLIIDLAPWDLRSVTTMLLHPESDTPSTLNVNEAYVLRPVQPRYGVYTHINLSNRLLLGGSTVYRWFGYAFLDITGNWGFSSVPQEVRDATIDCVVAWLRRDLSSVSYGGMMDLDSTSTVGERPASGYTIPLSARQKLDPFRRSMPAL